MKFRSWLYYIFLAAVLLSPLPLGSNRPWAWLMLSSLIGTLMVLEAFVEAGTSRQPTLKRLYPLIFVWLGCAFWALVQALVPMPDSLAHPLWFEAAVLTATEPDPRISINPQSGLSATTLFLTYGGIFWLAVRFCDTYERAQLALKTFVVAQIIYAVYGLIMFFSGLEMILWLNKWAYRGFLTSTFVNRNSYATYAGLGVLATTTFLFVVLRRDLMNVQSQREFWRTFLDVIFKKAWVPFLGAVVTATALLLTSSRGGFLSTALAFFVLVACLTYVQILPKKLSRWLMGGAVLISLFVFGVSGEVVLKRLERTTLDSSVRDELYIQTAEAVLNAPLLGSGYGTYEQAFLPYKDPELARFTWDKAHNTYLELAMELGIVATGAIVLTFVAFCIVFIFGMARRRRRRQFSVLALTTTLLVGAHSIVDFSMQIPAVAVSVALLLGLGWAQSWPTSVKSRPRRT